MVKDEGANRPVGMLARIPDKQTAMLITTMAAALKTARIERGVDARLSRATCERTDHGRLWILERWSCQEPLMRHAFFTMAAPGR